MKVDFIIIGAAKCGTTTLANILSNHPDINFSKQKEPHFFSRNKNWKKGIPKYHKLFIEESGKIYGEASTSYSSLPFGNLNICNDIYKYNPKMKIIYIIRNPIHRAISAYMQNYQRGRINYSIEKFIKTYPNLIAKSRYYTQIIPYIKKFSKEQVLILHFEDLIHKKKDLLKQISEFLKIDFQKFKNYEQVHSNVSIKGKKLNYKYDKLLKYLSPVLKKIPNQQKDRLRKIITNPKRIFKDKPKLSKEYQEIIINMTKLDLMQLEEITGRNYSDWMKVDTNLF